MKFKKTYNHKLSSHRQSPHSTEFPQEPITLVSVRGLERKQLNCLQGIPSKL